MRARPTDEPHRVSSPLELLFDLTFVVAIAAVTARLAHGIAGGHGPAGLLPFLQVFFAIWWAWMNFTWFASSYDTDDVAYRLLTMVQMAGVLVLAAGVPAAADDSDYRAVTLGYLIMRIGLVAQWLRAGAEDAPGRRTALRYAAGITVVQVGWVLRLLLSQAGVLPPSALLPFFAGLAVLELAVPRWAERAGATSWHPHHIAERYGLFTIILLGESVLAATTGVEGAIEAAELSGSLVVIAVSGLVLLFALWWLYFLAPAGEGLSDRRHRSYLWGYGHYGVFAALAALGAGLEVAVEQTGHSVGASSLTICYAVAIPVGVFLALLWVVPASILAEPVVRPAALLGCVAVVLLLPFAAPWIGVAAVVAAIAAVCVLLIAVTLAPGSG
ncbi:low temperature requirement protein A [Streptosporangium sp. NPDC023963]|uniref:low temperature requirement protein A n=1 Tax=Streptosporangium sp. NPDC023963 TaxID=3155608 RepID=UPI00341816A4